MYTYTHTHTHTHTQQVTFTNWFNDRLGSSKSSYSGPKVKDLSIDLHDGVLLLRLLENLTGKKIYGYEKSPQLTAHKMVNLDLAFEFMKKEEIKLVGIGERRRREGEGKLRGKEGRGGEGGEGKGGKGRGGEGRGEGAFWNR